MVVFLQENRSFDHYFGALAGVREPNLSAWRRAVCGDLTEACDFGHPDFSVPDLPGPEPMSCPAGERPPLPEVQGPPAQEQGRRPRVP